MSSMIPREEPISIAMLAQQVKAIERTRELAAEQAIEANAQPLPKEPIEARFDIQFKALEVSV